ncbi:MAG: AAA family ATPase [Proteobacteria bacterium]|nr:AAA family ATPase [Pseudomonadota bacterium]
MINRFQLIRNIGQFDSVTPGGDAQLSRLTLVYAENGRGKTTLAAILRSLGLGDPTPIQERRRLGAEHGPHVVVGHAGGDSLVFQDGSWTRHLPELAVFDDIFVDENVFSGLSVDTEHRKNLHELILGARGVALGRRVQELAQRIEVHNTALRAKSDAIPEAGRAGVTVDTFCALPPRSDIDEAIRTAESNLAAVEERNPIRDAAAFGSLALPELDAEGIDRVLQQDLPGLDKAAAERVQAHIARLAEGAEAWISQGMLHAAKAEENDDRPCPYCAQDLNTSDVFGRYRAYFSDEYEALKRSVSTTIDQLKQTHSAGVLASFERAVGALLEKRSFWGRFCEVPAIELDTATIVADWQAAAGAVLEQLSAKQSGPLERSVLSARSRELMAAHEAHRQAVERLNAQLGEANRGIAAVKEQAAAGTVDGAAAGLALLLATRARHSPEIAGRCREYLEEKEAKALTEGERARARQELDDYRVNVFPQYQEAINAYLERFNVGFRLQEVCPVNVRSGSACNYNVVVNGNPVPIGREPQPGTPSFRTTLSAGDRSTLALAFFFAYLDHDPDLANKVVVLDDPMTSLDEHRTLATIQEIRSLARRSAQVIVLSHSKPFLCRIWDGTHDRSTTAALHVPRSGDGSSIARWEVQQDCITEHDKRHTRLREYRENGGQNSRQIAADIRPLLEAFLRVAFPGHFPPGQLLGPFCGLCDQRVGSPQEVLNAADIGELRAIIEYANRFHHDTNPAWETEVINDGELSGFVARALRFAR